MVYTREWLENELNNVTDRTNKIRDILRGMTDSSPLERHERMRLLAEVTDIEEAVLAKELETLTEQKDLAVENIKKQQMKAAQASDGIISLKNVTAEFGLKLTTKVQVVDIIPVMSVRAGYISACTKCGSESVSQYKEPKCDCGTKCVSYPRQITGMMCTAMDPTDTGGNPAFIEFFFPNTTLPQANDDRTDLEFDLQTSPFIITGTIRVTGIQKSVINWFVEVESYKKEETSSRIDIGQIKRFGTGRRDDTFFERNFIPSMYGKILSKKINALVLLSPEKVLLPNGKVEWAVGSHMELGDPGQNKTMASNELLRYCAGTPSQFISVENSTSAGMIAAVQKNPNTGRFTVKVGKIPLADGNLAVLDGVGKIQPQDFAQIRGILAEKQIEIVKAGGLKKRCVVRMIALGNLIKRVSDYATKHAASFDLAASSHDIRNKFSNADRRRWHHVTVCSNADVDADRIDEMFLQPSDGTADIELRKYWNRLREFAWSLEPEKVRWANGVGEMAQVYIRKLRRKYADYMLEYGILAKAGLRIFMAQLPAVAILHESISDRGEVMVTQDHCRWLCDLYDAELTDLGLPSEVYREQYFYAHAQAIIANADKKVLEVLSLLHRYGSFSSIEDQEIMDRTTMWRYLTDDPVRYSLSCDGTSQPFNYSFMHGTGKVESYKKGDDIKYRFTEPDGDVEPIRKRDGTLTRIGAYICKLAHGKLYSNIKPVTIGGLKEEKVAKRTVLDIISELDGKGKVVLVTDVLKMADMDEDDFEAELQRLKDKNEIFEVRPGQIKRLE